MAEKRRVCIYDPGTTLELSSGNVVDWREFLFVFNVENRVENHHTVRYLKLSSFVYSLTNLTSLAVPYILKDTLLLSPAQVGLFSALCSAPSILKPVVTLIVPPSGRSVTLSACALVQTFAYLGIGLAVAKAGASSAPLVCGFMFAHSVASSISMVIRDTLTVESAAGFSSDHEAHLLFTDLSMIQRIGLLPVSYLSGFLLNHISPGRLILISSIFPAIMAGAASTLYNENNNRDFVDTKTQIARSVDVIAEPKNGLFSTVTGRGLLTCIVPSVSDAMFFFYTQELGLSPEFLGRFQFLGAVGGILGNAFSRSSMHAIDPRTVSNISTVLQVPLFFSTVLITSRVNLGISVSSFILARHFLIDFLGSLNSIPASVQLMKTAPKNAQGTYLALVGTLSDIGGFANSIISSATMTAYGIDRTHFSSITNMVIMCNTIYAGFVPALFFYDDHEPCTTPIMVNDEAAEPQKIEEVDGEPSPTRDA